MCLKIVKAHLWGAPSKQQRPLPLTLAWPSSPGSRVSLMPAVAQTRPAALGCGGTGAPPLLPSGVVTQLGTAGVPPGTHVFLEFGIWNSLLGRRLKVENWLTSWNGVGGGQAWARSRHPAYLLWASLLRAG